MIKIRNLTKKYNDKIILNNLDLDILKGEVVLVTGKSGVGKTTLLNIIANIDEDYKGEVKINSDKISYVFQEHRLIPWLTVIENIKFVLSEDIKNFLEEKNKKSIDDYIYDFLDKIDMEDSINKYPNELSGGMKQRVSLARAFIYPHDILLLDEPFVGLDDELKIEFIKIMKKLIKMDKKTIILVTHDTRNLEDISNKIIEIK